jgi:predicted lipoprotein with Yx(FWY)xxD motif
VPRAPATVGTDPRGTLRAPARIYQGLSSGGEHGRPVKRILIAIVLASAATAALAAPEAMARGAKLKIDDSEYGRVLMNARGKALYLFDIEESKRSKCYGDCAVAWPPFLTRGKPRAGDGVKPKLLGTTLRTDGTRQVTYKRHPLYFYEHDSPGVILCQDVFEFGGNWLLVNRRGNAVR